MGTKADRYSPDSFMMIDQSENYCFPPWVPPIAFSLHSFQIRRLLRIPPFKSIKILVKFGQKILGRTVAVMATTHSNMADHSPMIVFYSHLCRISGCFPLQFGPGRSLKFKLISLPTLYTLIVSLLYFLSVLDYLYVYTKSHQDSKTQLSEMLLLYPSTIGCALSDLIIRVASVVHVQKLLKLTAFLKDAPAAFTATPSMGRRSKFELLIYSGLVLYAVYAVTSFITNSAFFPEDSVSVLCGCGSCENHRVVSIGMFMCDLWHDGLILSATSFLAIFGFRLVKTFRNICGNISFYCSANWRQSLNNILDKGKDEMPCKNGLFAIIQNNGDALNVFRSQFNEFKLSFDIFSEIAGIFTFALLVEIVTVLFYAAGNALLESSNSELQEFLLPFAYNMMTVLIFMIIVEMGNYMVTEMQGSTEELQDVLLCSHYWASSFSSEAKQVIFLVFNFLT